MVYDRAYGYHDTAQTQPLATGTPMLTASIVKPVTAAMIQQLAASGQLSLDDHVFCTGSNAPCRLSGLLTAGSDPRAADVTVRHLLAHQGGWDPSVSGDPQMLEAEVQAALGLTEPPQQADDIRWVMSHPLDCAPGTRTVYLNFGYLVLGRIVEQASGSDYVSEARRSIFKPLGVADGDFEAAAPLLADRDPREPAYITTLTGPSVFVPGTTVSVLDGFVNATNWIGADTAVTTARAMALFAGRYRIQTRDGGHGGPDGPSNGLPLNGMTNDGYHNGSLPGCATIVRQLPNGVSYAVFMNKRDEVSTGLYQSTYAIRIAL